MRILMISDVYVPRVNGVSTSIQTFRKELEDLGHEVYLIAPHYEQCLEQEHRLFRVESRGVPGDPEDRMMKYGKVLGLIPTIEKLDIDLVHIQTPFVAHYAGMKIARALFLTFRNFHSISCCTIIIHNITKMLLIRPIYFFGGHSLYYFNFGVSSPFV